VSAGLGAVRLSIIDLETGRQPIANEDETVWAVHNGEIYNFQALKVDLEARGHRFKSRSDTEVIVHAYEEYGNDCVLHFDGMFAFAVWDDASQRLLLGRDRLGKKPLLYARRNGGIVFASEFRPLLLDQDLQRDVDLQALDVYLTYLSIPAPLSIYRTVRKLPPAHLLTLDSDGAQIRRYWDLAYTPKLAISEEEASQQLAALLTDSVRKRLISEVPLGAFLSGGMDSSIVTAIMSRVLEKPVKTFSIGFEEEEYNELPYARAVARYLGTDHHEFVVKPSAVEVVPGLVEHFGEPFADSSAVPTYYLSRCARPYVTVALTGDGGDELFAGYGRHLENRAVEKWQRLPRGIRVPISLAAMNIIPPLNRAGGLGYRLGRFLSAANLSRLARYERWAGLLTPDLKASLAREGPGPTDPEVVSEVFRKADALDSVDSMLAIDTAFYLPTDLLVKMDITSMANSLETRSPFLDYRLVEFVASLPSNMKIRRLTSKYLLKRTFRRMLPRAVIHRPKHGFAVPIGRWLRREWRDLVTDYLLSARFAQRGLFRRSKVEDLIRLHLSGQADYSHHLWALLVLELWHRAFLDRSE
jgi:asparagine synthase (glutamine-hydrolysing)